MSDWIRNPKTGKIDLNVKNIDDIIRKLMDRVKCLTQEKNKAMEELETLKETLRKVEQNANMGKERNVYDDDDSETDGAPLELQMNELHISPTVGMLDKSKDITPKFCPIDHSACCSKELTLKLVEQNQILQKAIKDILNINGSSLDEYLKFTYSRDKLSSKDQEVRELKGKIKHLEDQLMIKVRHPVSQVDTNKQFVNLRLAEPIRANQRPPTLNPGSPYRSKSSTEAYKCGNCFKNFDDPGELSKHISKCLDMG